jgi:hypothetical protein
VYDEAEKAKTKEGTRTYASGLNLLTLYNMESMFNIIARIAAFKIA